MKQTANFLEESKKSQTHQWKIDIILLNKKKTKCNSRNVWSFYLVSLTQQSSISVRSTRVHIFLLNRLNLGRKEVTKQEFTLLWEKKQENSLTAFYAAVIEKVNKYHFWKNLRWERGGCDGHTQLSLWSPNFLSTQRSWSCSQFDRASPGCRRKLPGHLRWIQTEECYLNASSSPSYWPALEQSQ